MTKRLLLGFFLCLSVSACGGGGSSVPQTQPTPGRSGGLSTVKISIVIPAAPAGPAAVRRRPRYISVNTQSAVISVNGGTPVIANLAAGSPNCTSNPGGGRTCTVAISAPVGADTFAEKTYATTDGTGSALSQTTTAATIVAGQANTVALTLDGIVASIALTLANPFPPIGVTGQSIGLTVNFYDASKAAIIGSAPFANPISLTDSDTTGATSVSKTTLNGPSDATALTVAYNGASIPPAVFSATAAGVPASSISPATLTPTASGAFVDWPTYGYDAQRRGFNPYTTGITPASLANFKIGWQAQLGTTQSQPIIATNVPGHTDPELIIGSYTTVRALDAYTGAAYWSRTLPSQYGQDCGTAGVSGTAVYDKSLNAIFVVAGDGQVPNHAVLYRLDAGSGAITGQTTVTPALETGEATIAHSALTLVNARIYLGTGSNCEGTQSGLPSWRGRVVSVDPGSMALLTTFYSTWGQGGSYGGGGVWSWGGVSSDQAGNIYVATGNAETTDTVSQPISPPFQAAPNEQTGYAEHLVQLSSDLSQVEASNYPGFNFQNGVSDLDYAGTPVIYQPSVVPGCGVLSATQGKAGTLVINNTQGLGVVNSFALSVPSGSAYYVGNPAFSPTTGLLYAAISSSGQGSSLLPPGLAAIGGCGSGISWNAQFGPDSTLYSGDHPRSAPTVTGGGVVFMGTPCTSDGNGGCGAPGTLNGALWAVDGTKGEVLGGGKPLLITADNIRMAPSVDGLWMYLVDDSGNLYGLTVDPNVKGVAAKAGRRAGSTYRRRAP